MSIKANIQLIKLDGLIRFGRFTGAFGKRFNGMAGFRFTDNGRAEILGLVKRGKFKRGDYEAITGKFREIGKRVDYERRDESGNLKRSVEVSKHGLPHVRDAMKNGKLDKHQAKKDLAVVIKAVDDGKVSIEVGDQVDGNGDHAAVSALVKAVASLDHNDVLVWFVRREK